MFHGIPGTRAGTGEGLLGGRMSGLRTSRCFTWNIELPVRLMFHVEHHLLCSLMMFHVEHSVVMRLFGRCRTSLTTLSSHPKYLVRSDPPVGVADECTAPHSARHLAGGAILRLRHVAVSPTSAHHVEGRVPSGRGDHRWDSGMSARLRRQRTTHVILLWRRSMRGAHAVTARWFRGSSPGRMTSDVLRGGKKTGDVSD